jgi:hypothetical protein
VSPSFHLPARAVARYSGRNLRWHRYDRINPAAHVYTLLAELDADSTAIFWG